MEKINVGIDVSKDRLDVAVRPSGERFAVSRTGAGLADLVARLKLKPNLIVLEATGGFETVVVAALAAASLPVAVANPAQIRAFAKAIGQRAKTDPIDAAVIAHFGEATGIVSRPLPDQATQQLADNGLGDGELAKCPHIGSQAVRQNISVATIVLGPDTVKRSRKRSSCLGLME